MLHQLREWLALALQRTGSNTLNDLDSFWTVSILPGMMQRSSSIVTQTPPMHIIVTTTYKVVVYELNESKFNGMAD